MSDFILKINAYHKYSDGTYSFDTVGKFDGNDVGLNLSINSKLTAGFAYDSVRKKSFCQNGVAFHSYGKMSDLFINAISKIYGLQRYNLIFKDGASFTALPMESNKIEFEKRRINIKLFTNYKNLDEYGEVYIYIDLPRHVIEVREKDESYRISFLKALSLNY
ncbi:MAG: hypothetical protein WCJ19_00745 [bacterium]